MDLILKYYCQLWSDSLAKMCKLRVYPLSPCRFFVWFGVSIKLLVWMFEHSMFWIWLIYNCTAISYNISSGTEHNISSDSSCTKTWLSSNRMVSCVKANVNGFRKWIANISTYICATYRLEVHGSAFYWYDETNLHSKASFVSPFSMEFTLISFEFV